MIDINKLTIEQLNQTTLWSIAEDYKIFSGSVQGYSIEGDGQVMVKLGRNIWVPLTECYDTYVAVYEVVKIKCSTLLEQNSIPS